ncbi:MAG: glycosyltransferase [Lachnospiraceae bacterium]|nr:glycosyltransferase [Lachnospiraceae bacterium]
MEDRYKTIIDMNKEDDSHSLILRQIRKGSRVLEVGPASGAMTQYMKEQLECQVSIIEKSEEGFRSASVFAEDGWCGDVESEEWEPLFKKKEFDYIIFADVLEHLHNPGRVLERVSTYLGTEGQLVISVPNIGYAGVLAELYGNRFDYRETGLLDETHCHFFSYYSMLDMLEQSGFRVIIADGTRLGIADSEFRNSAASLPEEIRTLLAEKRLSDVYQFVVTAVKQEYFDSQNLNLDNRLDLSRGINRSRNVLAEPQQYEAEIKKLLEELEESRKIAEHFQEHYLAAINQRNSLTAYAKILKESKDALENATFWKMTKPLRDFSDVMKRLTGNKNKKLDNTSTSSWKLTEEEREKQTKERFSKDISFSILVPVYNTDRKFLEEMIASVEAQTFRRWQLCLADSSDSSHSYVGKICRRYAKKDSRICYQHLKENLGISENTNAAARMAKGRYLGLLDHDDWLHPSALYECAKAIHEQDGDVIYTDEDTFRNHPKDAYCPHFKPDFSPDTLRSYNYVCHFLLFKKTLFKEVGGFRKELDGSQDYDFILRLSEKAEVIVHIPRILYYWRAHKASVAESLEAKPYVIQAAHKALEEHLRRLKLNGEVLDSSVPSTYRIRYELKEKPLVSILIPNMNQMKTLKKCIDSILQKTSYENYEIIVIENNSTDPEIYQYYKELEKNQKIRVVYWDREFNYSAINNYGAGYAKGKYLVLLNNDIEILSKDWIQEMLMFAQRKDVGAVGMKLYYPDDTVQHAGVILGIGGVAGHSHKYFPRNHVGYSYRLTLAQNLSAVTAASMMIPTAVYKEVGGLDEAYQVAFNDVDLCMKIRRAGYLIVFTPYAEAYHYESKSRGREDTREKQTRAMGEINRFRERWKKELQKGDPYYNPNLTLTKEDFSLREEDWNWNL